ncbi:PREDICTED: uncharacterized protein LOC106814988 [Priapulus caudatus]|uniref:Uncharacterized protein LOC106814988 n=1 Tax=Priapulus caudatus TaxID=37621 RepID=A0ABM1ERQ4_PRICU|nr:PREDICTED: uncharacterized protein LOC106814988 [Priapulus caudatus]
MTQPTDEEQQAFLQTLNTNTNIPAALSLFESTSAAFKSQRVLPPTPQLPATLRSNFNDNNKQLGSTELQQKCEDLAQSLSVSRDEITHLEKHTRSQAKSLIWHEHRSGRITASSAYTILHTDSDKPAPSVILRSTKPNPTEIRAAPLVYGRENEKRVFMMAGQFLGKTHSNFELSQSGLMISEEKPWLSASADGVMQCSCHGTRVLEIKCPYTARNSQPEEFLHDQSLFVFDGTLKKTHQYYTQVELEMYVHNVEACEFVVYVNDSLIHRTITRDEEYLTGILPRLETFWKRHITRELLTRYMEDGDSKKDDKLYCYCQKAWDKVSVLVGCDGLHCPFEWVHLGCIRPVRKTVPKGTWYCRQCKKNK